MVSAENSGGRPRDGILHRAGPRGGEVAGMQMGGRVDGLEAERMDRCARHLEEHGRKLRGEGLHPPDGIEGANGHHERPQSRAAVDNGQPRIKVLLADPEHSSERGAIPVEGREARGSLVHDHHRARRTRLHADPQESGSGLHGQPPREALSREQTVRRAPPC